MTIYLRSSKTHSQADKPRVIHKDLCPFGIIADFAQVRGRRTYTWKDPFLVHQDGSPIAEHQYRDNLAKMIAMLGYNPSFYGTHSFRCGRANDLKRSGRTIPYIKNEGRWTATGTVYKYFIE